MWLRSLSKKAAPKFDPAYVLISDWIGRLTSGVWTVKSRITRLSRPRPSTHLTHGNHFHSPPLRLTAASKPNKYDPVPKPQICPLHTAAIVECQRNSSLA